MDVFLCILAAILWVIAGVMVFLAIEKESVVPIGVAALIVAGGVFLFWHGIAGEHAKFLAKHRAIYRDATTAGFNVRDENVNARGGKYLVGTEVDIIAGNCVFPFNATKINGTWQLTLPAQDGNGVHVIKASAVSQLKRACS